MGRREARRPFYITIWYGGTPEERTANAGNTVVRADGMTIAFEDGRTFEDWTGQAFVNNIGLGRAEVAKALADQAIRLSWASPGEFADVRLALTADLREVLPAGLTTPFFGVGGSDSVEAAIRAARKVTRRSNVLSFEASYHGDTMTMEHVSGTGLTPYGDPRPWVVHAPSPYSHWQRLGDWDRAQEATLEGAANALKRRGPRTFAAILFEPVMGIAGAVPFARDTAHGLRELADRHGIKLLADEVITGFGRTGEWFGSQSLRVRPDAVVLAKGLTGGYAPLGAAVFERGWGAELRRSGFPHGLTFGAHPVGCAAARETIRILHREALVARSKALGAALRRRLEEVAEAHPSLVRDVRGAGLFVAMELRGRRAPTKRDAVHPAWPRVKRVWEALGEEGTKVTTNSDGSSILLCPPFVVTEAQVDRLGAGVDRQLRAL
jgi:taurine--2-oxoglutarate transaminase